MKRTITTILATGLLAMFVSACGPNHEIRATLRKAEMQMQEKPEQALELLKTVSARRREMSAAVEARYALLYSQAQDKCYQAVDNDSLIRIAVDRFQTHGNRLDRARTYYYYGVIHHNAHDIEGAMEALVKAQLEAEESDDSDLQGLICSELGNLYYEQYCFSEAAEMYDLAIDIFTKNHNEENILIASYCKGLSLYYNKHKKEATHYLLEAKALAIKADITTMILDIEILLGLIKIEQNNDLVQINELKNHLSYTYTLYTNQDIPVSFYPIMGHIYIKERNIDSARYYITTYLKSIKNISSQNVGFIALLSNIENQSGNYKAAYQYEKLYSHLSDSINDSMRKNEVRALNQKFRNKELKDSYKAMKKKRTTERLCIIIGIMIIGILISTTYLRIARKREQERTEYDNYIFYAKKHYAELEEKYNAINQKDLHAEALQMLLQSRMDDMKRELELAALYESKPESFHKKYKETKKLSPKGNCKAIDEMIAIANLSNHGVIDYINRTFPKLTRYELCYCALVYLGFSPQTIRFLFGHTHDQSLYSISGKIREKMHLTKSSDHFNKQLMEFKEIVRSIQSEQ